MSSTRIPTTAEYSVDNAIHFHWSSVTGSLNQERLLVLEKHLVGSRILDVGCGGGGYVGHLTAQGRSVVGLDKYSEFLASARSRNVPGMFVRGDLNARLPFRDAAFETTFCFDVLEHVDDLVALRELARVTSRRLILAVPKADERTDRYMLTFCPYLDQTHLRYYTEESLHRLVHTVRPEQVQIFPEGRVPFEGMVRREAKIESRRPGLGLIYQALFRFLSRRIVGPDWHVGLIAVVDLFKRVE